MQHFDALFDMAVRRRGGPDALEKELVRPRSRAALSRVKDDRVLAGMSQAVFRAGFVWHVVEAKWPGFEEAFEGFEPTRVAGLSDRRLDALGRDERVIRNRVKLESVRDNARFVLALAAEHGRAARFLSRWPPDDLVGLWAVLKAQGSRLGGNTGPSFLRELGKDTFLLTDDVVRALAREGVLPYAKAPTSRKSLAAVQAAFDRWHAQSARPYCQISQVLAIGTG